MIIKKGMTKTRKGAELKEMITKEGMTKIGKRALELKDLYYQEEDKLHKERDKLFQDKCQTSRVATYCCRKKMTRKRAKAHQPTTFSCDHICTQTTRGMRTFIQCTKQKKTISLERGWRFLQTLSNHARKRSLGTHV